MTPDGPEAAGPLVDVRALPYDGMTLMSEADLECLALRHLCRDRDGMEQFVVGAGRRCRHGWPQAILYDPLFKDRRGRFRLGDTTRLTCPWLVSIIDKIEKAGVMLRYNERLHGDELWMDSFERANEAHRVLRRDLTADRPVELESVQGHLGPTTFEIAMDAGLCSVRRDAVPDVKCLHAQVADELVRGDNLIAQQALRDIEELGFRADGGAECCDHCDVRVPLGQGRWQFSSCKNSLGKKLSRANHRR